MARPKGSAQVCLRLDVIVEEEHQTSIKNSELTREVTQDYTGTESNTTCTVTLQNFTLCNGNDPQFLHTGKWPGLDLIDDTIEDRFKLIENNNPADINGSSSPMYGRDRGDVDAGLSLGSSEDVCNPIGPDQLSMAMDHWNPDEDTHPVPRVAISNFLTGNLELEEGLSASAVQQSLFFREIVAEYLTRTQTVEYIGELEDNDNVVEIVAILEGYRQNGWAGEMLKAFPRECRMFWFSTGVGHMHALEDIHECEEEDLFLVRFK